MLRTRRRTGSSGFHPTNLAAIANGYLWDPDLYEGTLGAGDFVLPELNGNSDFDMQEPDTGRHPTAITTNGHTQFRFSEADRLLAATANNPIGWSTSTGFGIWLRFPSGIPNGAIVMQHSGGATLRHFYIQFNTSLGLRFFVSTDGTTLLEHRVTSLTSADTEWHRLVCRYRHAEATATDRTRVLWDGTPMAAASPPSPGATINDAATTLQIPPAIPSGGVVDIGPAFLANGDLTDAEWELVMTAYKSPL